MGWVDGHQCWPPLCPISPTPHGRSWARGGVGQTDGQDPACPGRPVPPHTAEPLTINLGPLPVPSQPTGPAPAPATVAVGTSGGIGCPPIPSDPPAAGTGHPPRCSPDGVGCHHRGCGGPGESPHGTHGVPVATQSPMGSHRHPWPPRAPQTPVVPEPYWSPWSPTDPEPRGSPWPPTQTPCPHKGPYPGVPAPLGCPGMFWGAFPLLQPLQPCPLGFLGRTQRTVTPLSQLLSPKVRTNPSLRSPAAIWGTWWPPAPHLPPAGNGEPRSCLCLGGALQLDAPPPPPNRGAVEHQSRHHQTRCGAQLDP